MSIIHRLKTKILFLIKCNLVVRKVISASEYAKISSNIELNYIKINRKTIIRPISFLNEPENKSFQINLPDAYISQLKNCSIIGKSNLILTNDKYLISDILYKKNSNINVTDTGILFLFNRAVHLYNYFIINYLRSSQVTIDKGILVSGNFSTNYYHFMFEILVKFYLINESKIAASLPIIIDKHILEIPQFAECLSIFNKRPVITIESSRSYLVKDLIFFSAINIITPNHKDIQLIQNTDFAFDFQALDFIRNKVLSNLNTNKRSIHKNIFISRINSSKRNFNEDEIADLLLVNNFKTIFPENLSFREQVDLFSNSDIIIGASGAAFTNIIFCKPNCKILILSNAHKDITIFSSIANHYKLDLQYLVGKCLQPGKLHSNFKINYSTFAQYLDRLDSK